LEWKETTQSSRAEAMCYLRISCRDEEFEMAIGRENYWSGCTISAKEQRRQCIQNTPFMQDCSKEWLITWKSQALHLA
jgi:hypothetical protein